MSAASRPTRPSRSTRSPSPSPCGRAATNDLAERLAADARLGLDREAIDAVLADRSGFVGAAPRQVEAFVRQVEAMVADHPDAARYRPEPIL